MNRNLLGQTIICSVVVVIMGCDQQPTTPPTQSSATNAPAAITTNTHADIAAWREQVTRQRQNTQALVAPSSGQTNTSQSSAHPKHADVVAADIATAQAAAAKITEMPSDPPPETVGRAQAGDVKAQLELGKFYGERWDLEKSNYWYRQAALQGDPRAQHMMGVRYTFGQGVPRDMKEAGRWFLLAAEQGDAQSQYSIGLRWARGEAGEPQDLAEAARWFELAANQGLGVAQLSLARRFLNGDGVAQDYVAAYKWALLAKNQKNVPGTDAVLNDLKRRMTDQQITEATAAANGFTPQITKPQG